MTTKTFKTFALIAGLTLTLVGSAFCANPASAMTLLNDRVTVRDDVEWGLGVSPAKMFFTAEPGSHYSGSYQAYNEGKNAFDFVIIVSPAYYTSDYSGYDFNHKSKWNNIVDWVEIDKGPFRIEPGQMVDIPFSVDVPEDALGESQFFAFINRIVPDEAQSNGVVNAVKQIGLVSSATINGPGVNGCAEIKEQKASWWQDKAPLKTVARIENCGNIDFYAAGKIRVENAFFGGGLVYDGPAEQLYLMPETERDFELNWDDAPIFGIFKVTQEVQIFDNPEIFEKVVIVCPLWLILVVLISILLIIFAIIYARKRKNKERKNRKS